MDILILIEIREILYCTTLTLIYDMLFSLRLMKYSVKEVKIFWGPGTGWERFFFEKTYTKLDGETFSDPFLEYQNGAYRWSKLL